eukprot:m.184944 g.184944  ORF g.184944 m.184944 type:complete len:379 (-) comp16275_c0_seq1:2644-3780(-)
MSSRHVLAAGLTGGWRQCHLRRSRRTLVTLAHAQPSIDAQSAAPSAATTLDLVQQAADSSGAAVASAQYCLGAVHAATGLPWWATIALVTATVRALLTTPAFIIQQRTVARYEGLVPHLRQWRTALEHKHRERARKEGYGEVEATQHLNADMKKVHKEVLKENGLWPLWARMQLPLALQIPVWITFSFALRGLVSPEMAPTELILNFASSGTLWFTNLAVPDVWYGLPLITATANLINLEVNGLAAGARADRKTPSTASPSPAAQATNENDTKRQLTIQEPADRKIIRDHVIKGFFRLLSVSMVWIGSQIPSAVCLYWCISSCYGVVQNLTFRLPAVRRAASIPPTPSESDRPFAKLAAQARAEWVKFCNDLRDNKGL